MSKERNARLLLAGVITAAFVATNSESQSVSTDPSAKAAVAHNISGSWLLTYDTRIGGLSETLHLAQVGSKLIGHTESGQEHARVYGKIEGTSISFSTGVDEDGKPKPKTIRVDYGGVLLNGEMHGFVDLGVFGKSTWKATRIENPKELGVRG